MKTTRSWKRIALVAVLCAIGAGCLATKKQAVRPSGQDSVPLVESKDDDPIGTKALTRSMFQPSRRPGGWSPEANSIEDHLGVR